MESLIKNISTVPVGSSAQGPTSSPGVPRGGATPMVTGTHYPVAHQAGISAKATGMDSKQNSFRILTHTEDVEGNLLSKAPLVPRSEGDADPSGLGTPQRLEVSTAKAVVTAKPGKDALVSNSGITSSASDGWTTVRKAGQKRKLRNLKKQTRRKLEKLAIQAPSDSATSANGSQAPDPIEPSSRKRSLGSTPGTSGKPPQKIRKVKGLTFSDTAKKTLSLFVGPTAGDAPLSVEEFVFVKRTLNKRVLDRARKTPEWPIQVESCTHHNGRVRVICSDERSLGWVREEARKLVPAPGSRKGFWVMGPGDLPPTKRCTAWVPLDVAESKKDLLQLLEASNTDLRVAGLHLTTEAPLSGQGHKRGRVCVFAVEEDTFQRLEALKMRPFCGMGRLEFRYRAPGAPPPPLLEAPAKGREVEAPGVVDKPVPLDSSTGAGGSPATGDKDDSSTDGPSGFVPRSVVNEEPCLRDLNQDSGS